MANRNHVIVWRALIVALVLAAVWACGGDDDDAAPVPYDEKVCLNGTPCINWADAGRCANRSASKCLSTIDGGKQCVYPLAISTTGCVCIENHAKICNLNDAGLLGVQMCRVRPDDGGTRWEDCEPLNPDAGP
jgi:hypothetical protein